MNNILGNQFSVLEQFKFFNPQIRFPFYSFENVINQWVANFQNQFNQFYSGKAFLNHSLINSLNLKYS